MPQFHNKITFCHLCDSLLNFDFNYFRYQLVYFSITSQCAPLKSLNYPRNYHNSSRRAPISYAGSSLCFVKQLQQIYLSQLLSPYKGLVYLGCGMAICFHQLICCQLPLVRFGLGMARKTIVNKTFYLL